MIEKDDELIFAATMRQKVLDLRAGIENATWDRFSDKSPNWLTRMHLERLVEDFESGLLSLGAKAVFAHSPCGDQHHEEKAILKVYGEGGHWRYMIADGRSDADLFVGGVLNIDGVVFETDWDELLATQTSCTDPCPCNPNKQAYEHAVARYFVWPLDAKSQTRRFVDLSFVLRHALRLADDRRPRSAIREQLLWVFITLEQLIVPITADEEVQRRKT